MRRKVPVAFVRIESGMEAAKARCPNECSADAKLTSGTPAVGVPFNRPVHQLAMP